MDAARFGRCLRRDDIEVRLAVLYPAYVCRAWLCVALMKSAEEGLISGKDSQSKVRFRFASPRSDLFGHHENVTCFNPVGCPSS